MNFSASSLASEKAAFPNRSGALFSIRGAMGAQMKSLESTYNGVVFRSRLEARWAALFDHYKLKWVYEPDAFHTESGPYLPDFYLPSLNAYVEVKPGPDQFDEVAVQSVSKQTKSDFLILDSPMIACRAYTLLKHPGEWTDMSWCCSQRYMPGGVNFSHGEHRFYVCVGGSGGSRKASGNCVCCDGGLPEPAHFARIRSMRFERGVAR
jgi:hypothetical protein